MNNQHLKYPIGATFSGMPFWIGLILLILSILSLFTSQYFFVKTISAATIPIGIIFLLSLKGAIVSVDTKEFYIFYNLIFFKWTASVIDLNNYKSVELRLYSDIETFQKIPQSTTVRTKVYEIYVKNENAKALIFESTDYKVAAQMLYDLGSKLDLIPINSYQIWRERIMRKRNKKNQKP